jgi:hypothetical protein
MKRQAARRLYEAHMRRNWLVLVLLLAIGSAAAAAWSLGGALSAPVPCEIGPPPDTLPGGTAVAFSSASGSHIRGWFAPGRPGFGSVVLAHAVRADRRHMLGRAEFLHRAGYSALLFDAQAHAARAAYGLRSLRPPWDWS